MNVVAHVSQLSAHDAHRAEVYIGAMMVMRTIRKVNAVERWVKNQVVLEAELVDNTARAKVAECREWLIEAAAYEQANGSGSLIDRAHPFWVEGIEPALRRARKIQLAGARST
jgi:hypothetical protein